MIEMIKKIRKTMLTILCLIIVCTLLFSCTNINENIKTNELKETDTASINETLIEEYTSFDNEEITLDSVEESEHIINDNSGVSEERKVVYTEEEINYDVFAPYATYSVIWDGKAKLYKIDKNDPKYNGKTVTVNAGHGTKGGTKFKTFSHPDFTPKVSGGTTAAGSILSTAVSDGTTLDSGMSEATANLVVAIALRDKLLSNGYSVLMIREDNDCRFDNVARTVITNENSDVHVAIHFDSTDTDKGIYFITPYNDENYLNMEPLKSNVNNIRKLGKCIINAFKEMGEKVWKDSGTLQGDLTQISYSTIPSVDIELGDKKTEITDEKVDIFAEGIKNGINDFFK